MDVKVCGGSLAVTGFIQDLPCEFTIDTGADVTILSYRLFDQLNVAQNLEGMNTNETLKGLDGREIPVLGKISLHLRLHLT